MVSNWVHFRHIDDQGAARMVDVTKKTPCTAPRLPRYGFAPPAEVVQLISAGGLAKVRRSRHRARPRGRLAAKRTSELIPWCHQLAPTGVEVEFTIG